MLHLCFSVITPIFQMMLMIQPKERYCCEQQGFVLDISSLLLLLRYGGNVCLVQPGQRRVNTTHCGRCQKPCCKKCLINTKGHFVKS